MHSQYSSLGEIPDLPKMSILIPRKAHDVARSVYGHARTDLCGSDAPIEAVEPCMDLKTVLANGVTEGEFGTLNAAVARLNQIYHFAPTQKK